MGKDGNFSGGAKVYESKKEKKRRLVANNELESEEFAVNPRVEIVQDGNGAASDMSSIVMEKGVSRTEVFMGKLGGECSKGNSLEARSEDRCWGIDVDKPDSGKIKWESPDFAGNQTDAPSATAESSASLNLSYKVTESAKESVSQSKSERKRSMEICDDEFNRKRTKPDTADNQTEKSGGDKTPTNVEHTDEGLDSAMDDVQVSNVPVPLAKERDGEGSSELGLHQGGRTDSKSKPVKRGRGRPRKRNHRNLSDARFSATGIKDDKDGGRSKGSFISVQGQNVKRVLQSRKKVAVPGDAVVPFREQDSTRRLRSSDTKKFSTLNHRLESQVSQKPTSNMKRMKSAGKAFSKDPSMSGFSKINQKIVSPNRSSKSSKLLHGKPDMEVKKGHKESDASRGETKRKLREQIKNILLDAGWKIEFRPRNNKDYEDSVYVSPHGGAGYWSIVKAYDVFLSEFRSACDDKESYKKQSKASANSEEEIAVIPPELLLLLKRKVINRRRTKKEMEEVKRRKEVEGGKHKVGVGRKKKKAKEVTKIRCSKNKGSRDDVGGTIAMKRKLIVKNSKRRGCALLVRGSDKDDGSEKNDYAPYVWKRTVLSWMIDLGLLTAYGKVRYMNKRRSRALLDGRITRDGIQCSCCSKICSVSKFEIHAGSKLHQPYENICMEVSGISLLQYQINAWETQESKLCIFYYVDTDGDDPNDDTCGICGDGGDLICCDSCPSTFHLGCLGIEMLPSGDWHCTNCSCKFCGSVHDPASQHGNASSSLFTCSQCAQKYHKYCVPEADAVSNVSNSLSNMFCGRSCRQVFRKLQKLIGVRNKLEKGFCWSIVRRFDDPSKSLPRMAQRVESNSKIAIAYAVMDECFVPIIDQRSGINLIHNVVYNCGANFNRLNFSGFYTFILERGDEIISAASVRIHDTRLAEMPFIGTRSMYRRQGMCRRLLKGIETALRSLCINKLIIPAISELEETWTTVFGFKPLDISQKEEIKAVNMLVFPDTGLLQKSLIKDSKKQRTIPELESKLEAQISEKIDEDCSVDVIIDSKESKCAEAIAIQSNLPVSEHATNLLPEASGCHIQLCRSVEDSANIDSDDLQCVCSCSNHVEKDLSPRNCSNEMVSSIQEPKKEVEDVINAFRSFRPPDDLLHTTSGIEASDCRSPKNESKSVLPDADLFENCNCEKEDENTSKPFSNGVVHDVSSEKCVLMEEDEDAANNTKEVELSHDDNGLDSNVHEENSEVCIDVRRHLSTSLGEGTCASSEVCANGCGANPKLSCISSDESSSPEKSELPLNQLKCCVEVNNSPDDVADSGSAKRLDDESINGIARTNLTTYEGSLSKFEDSTAGLRPHFSSASEVGDECCADVCDVTIEEKSLDVMDPSHVFDLSTVKQASKMLT